MMMRYGLIFIMILFGLRIILYTSYWIERDNKKMEVELVLLVYIRLNKQCLFNSEE
jgi:hypothetical protein